MSLNRRYNQSGQGLMETLAIILLISVSIVGFLKFQHYLTYSSDITQQQSYANLLATNKIEQLRDYQVLNPTAGYTAYSAITSGSGTSTLSGVTYTVTWTVTTNADPAYKTIDVSVTWTDRTSTTQTVRLTSRVDSLDPGTQSTYM